MKSILLLITGLILSTLCYAQQKALTETGKEVILHEDGTWTYSESSDVAKTEIPTNSKKFKKSSKASFLLKSSKCNIGVWFDPKKWQFAKAKNNEEAEYEIQLKGEDFYALLIAEKVEIPLETLKEIAFQNGKSVAPDLRIVKEEYRMVNGLKVLFMQMDGTIQGIKFSYYGYYYSNSKGTVQFLTYTSQNLMAEYLEAAEELLNGLVEYK